MSSNTENQPNSRLPERAPASAGLDLAALRRKRDLEVAARAPVGALAIEVATLWRGRLAGHQARRQPTPQPEPNVAGSRRTALWSLSPVTRLRLWHGNSGMPPNRFKVTIRES